MIGYERWLKVIVETLPRCWEQESVFFKVDYMIEGLKTSKSEVKAIGQTVATNGCEVMAI